MTSAAWLAVRNDAAALTRVSSVATARPFADMRSSPSNAWSPGVAGARPPPSRSRISARRVSASFSSSHHREGVDSMLTRSVRCARLSAATLACAQVGEERVDCDAEDVNERCRGVHSGCRGAPFPAAQCRRGDVSIDGEVLPVKAAQLAYLAKPSARKPANHRAISLETRTPGTRRPSIGRSCARRLRQEDQPCAPPGRVGPCLPFAALTPPGGLLSASSPMFCCPRLSRLCAVCRWRHAGSGASVNKHPLVLALVSGSSALLTDPTIRSHAR